jgi:hypothetical protein
MKLKARTTLLPLLTIRTPIDGIFLVVLIQRTGQMLKVWATKFMWETTWVMCRHSNGMKVNTTISENDFMKIAVGQKVTVRLDALPKVEFEGEIMYVGKLCRLKENKSKQKVFDVEVKILKSDERLKPGMTVSCEYLLK